MHEKERVITISYTTIIRVIFTIVGLVFLWAIRDIIALIFVALVLAAVMMPFVSWIRHFRIPASLGVIIFYLLLFGGVGSAFALILPKVVEQLSGLGKQMITAWNALSDGAHVLQGFGEQYGLQENVQAGIVSIQSSITDVIGNAFLSLTGIFGGIAGLMIVIVLAYYMVAEEKEARTWLQLMLPDKHQDFVMHLLTQMRKKFGRWLIGQLALSATVGILYFIALTLLGIKSALVLSIFAAFAEFIPYLGPMISGVFVVIIAFSQSPVLALVAIAVMILIQQIENHILTPKIMQKAVGLNPVVSIIALLIGVKIFGFVGIVLAIPVATATMVAWIEIQKYRKTPITQIDQSTQNNQ